MRPIYRLLNNTALAAIALIVASCNDNGRYDALASVGTAVLTHAELHDAMPLGLSQTDSAKFAETYIRNWIDDKLIDQIAVHNIPDTREIDRLTEEYRRQLILHEYRNKMAESYAETEFPDDTLKAWYDLYGATLRTTAPLIKGIYLKLPAESPVVADMRRYIRSTKETDIDKIEQNGAPIASDYEYFRDRWVEWSYIEAKLPEYFIGNDDSWLRTNKKLDRTSGGFTHLLDITEYLPTGSKMPYELAMPLIRERLIADSRQEYDRQLRRELYDKALADGKIVIY